MPDESSTRPSDIRRLLGDGDASPVSVINPDGRSPFLLIGDHAGNAIPKALGTMGLSDADRCRHIAWDIGTADLGAELARLLDATFIHQRYSRLVIDCNRAPDRADAMPEASDGSIIVGNLDLSADDRARRIEEIHKPYHLAIEDAINAKAGNGSPVLVSLHSFTPFMGGTERPWNAGVLHDGANDGFAKKMLDSLRGDPKIVVGDNEPYLMDDTDYSVPLHAFAAARPYVELEISQRDLGRAGGPNWWAMLLAKSLEECLWS